MGQRRRTRGEETILQRTDGRWMAQVSLGWQGGKRRRKNIYGRTKKDVAKELRKVLAAQDKGQVIQTGTQTLGQFLTWWLEDVKRSSVRQSTCTSYEQKIRLDIVPELGKIRLDTLTPQRVQTFLRQKGQDGLAPAMVRSLRVLLVGR